MTNGLYQSSANGASKVQSSRNSQVVEVSVFLFLIVPSMALSFFAVKQGSLSFVLVAFATILRDLALVSLILFFLWRNGEPINWIGWTFKNLWKEIGLGIGLYIPFFIAAGFLERVLQVAGLSVPSTPLPSMAAKGMGELLLAIALVALLPRDRRPSSVGASFCA